MRKAFISNQAYGTYVNRQHTVLSSRSTVVDVA